jgi:diketogulonate reductase-like aldo/keto reductase
MSAAGEGPLLIDTAPAYANGQAEKLLGSFVSHDERIHYMTKLRIQRDDGPTAGESLTASLAALNRSEVDFLCSHWSGSADQFRRDLEVLVEAKNEGVAREIGIGNPTLSDLKIAQAEGVLKYVTFVQAEYSLSDSSISSVLQAAGVERFTVFGYSPLSEGRLAPNRRARQVIRRVAYREGLSDSEVVLAYLMRTPSVRPITVSSRPERHLKNIDSGNVHLAAESWAELDQIDSSITVEVCLGDIEVTRDLAGAQAYTSLHEAQLNEFGLTPSPEDLSAEFLEGAPPLKLLKVTPHPEDGGKFLLVQGQLRYWAQVMAFGTDHHARVVVTDSI